MMYKYGKRSVTNLQQCDQRLQLLMLYVLRKSNQDLSVICGHRGKEEQNKAYKGGKSQLFYPQSKHNRIPSIACDVVPYPIDWNDIDRYNEMCDLIDKCAKELDIDINLGRDWRMRDYPHIELKD